MESKPSIKIAQILKVNILLSLLTALLYATPSPEKPKSVVTPEKKYQSQKISVNKLREMSLIAQFTDTEELLLEQVSNSPRKTRDALVRMMKRRRDSLKAINQRWLETPVLERIDLENRGLVSSDEMRGVLSAYLDFDSQIPKMEALKFN